MSRRRTGGAWRLGLRAWVCLVGGALVAPGAFGVAAAEAQTAPDRYLVVPFENASGEPRVYWLSEASAVILTDDLISLGVAAITRNDRLRAFDRLRVPPVSTLSHATVIRLGQLVGAAQVVVGVFELQGEDIVVRARTIELDTGQISPELVERGPLSDLLAVYGRIARRIVPDSPISAEQMELGQPSLAAVEQFIKGLLAETPDTQIAYLTQALRLFPNLQRARVALWHIQTEASEHLAALAIIRQVPPGHRLTRQARFLAALSFLHLGQYQEAFSTFAELQREMSDPTLLNNLGVVQLRRPDPASGGAAVSYFAEAIEADPNDPDLFFNLGYAHWLNKDLPASIQWLREAVRRNPADDAAHYLLGVALQASGRAAEAAREKDLARRLSSVYAEWEAAQPAANSVPRGLERLKSEIDIPASLRAQSAVVAAGQRDQRATAAFHLENGHRLFAEGRDLDAIAELRRTVFLSPYESEAHLLLGRIYLRLGRQQEAIDALKIAVWSDPGNGEAQALLDSVQ